MIKAVLFKIYNPSMVLNDPGSVVLLVSMLFG